MVIARQWGLCYFSETDFMKKHNAFFRHAFTFLAAAVFVSLLSSCDVYYFSHPQPADKENVYEFPAELRGAWQEECDNETVIIEARNLSFTNKVTRRVAQGY